MKIAVIAANGRSGKAFVKAALIAGHTINAGVRGNHSFAPQTGLSIIHCDATKLSDVKQLLKDQDAVVSFVGHVRGSSRFVQTDTTHTLIEAMRDYSINRLVSLTGTGVRCKGDVITLVDRILNMSIALIDRNRVEDGIKHVAVLRESSLDWTVLRVLKLQDTKPKGYTLLAHGPTKLYVSREDVAAAALEVLEKQSFVREAPILGKKEASAV